MLSIYYFFGLIVGGVFKSRILCTTPYGPCLQFEHVDRSHVWAVLAEQEAVGHAVVGGEEQVGKEPQPPHPQRHGSGQTWQTQAEKE